MIWILGGTSETKLLLDKIRGQGFQYVITVATESGKAVLPSTEPVLVGRMDSRQMRQFLQEHTITTVVDLTHPYATEVTQNVRQVCREAQIRYLRYVRATSDTQGAVLVSSLQECLTFLRTISGCVFFTTGSTHIADFQHVRGHNRFVYRVLPTVSSLKVCHEQQVDMKDVVAAVGPFSTALNAAMFQEYQADYVVMKDSGIIGGTPEKLQACLQLGMIPVIIGRTRDEGIDTVDKLAKILRKAEKS